MRELLLLVFIIIFITSCSTRCKGVRDKFCNCNEKRCESCGKVVKE
jgi:hypothetical protein